MFAKPSGAPSLLVSEADVHLDTLRRLMPSPLGQLPLIIELLLRDLALIPAAVLFAAEHGRPKTFPVVACFRFDSFHVSQEQFLQHVLVERLWMLVDGRACNCEDGAGLEAHGQGRSSKTLVVNDLLEVLRRCLGASRACDCTFW